MSHSPPRRRTALAGTAFAILLTSAAVATVGGCQRQGDAASLIASANKYRAQGDTRAAIIELKNLLQVNADDRAARALLAEMYLEQGDPVSAEKELRRAIALGAPSAQSAPLLGRALLMQGHYEQLLAELLAPTAADAQVAVLSLRANALLGLGKQAAAKAGFERALERQGSDADALLGLARIAIAQDRPAEAQDLILRAVAAHPDNAECVRFQGDLLRVRGQASAAMAVYRNNLARHPHSALAHVDMANLLIDGGHFADARAHLEAARNSADSSLLVMHSQAMLDYREGKPTAARDTLQLILRAAPEHYPSILLMGTVQLMLGSVPQAEQNFKRFLGAYPKHPFATRQLALTYLQANNPPAALALLQPQLGASDADPDLLAIAGEASLRLHQFAAAGDYFERASAMRPQLAQWHTALALSRLGDGDNGRAVAELERAGELERLGLAAPASTAAGPASAGAGASAAAANGAPRADNAATNAANATRNGVLLVMAHLRARAPDKALAAVLLLEQRGDNPLVANLKGAVYIGQQDWARARASFTHALALDPVYLPALDNLAQLDLMAKRPADASQRYRDALARAPRNSAVMEALARLAASQGQRADAIAWLEQARAANPAALPLGLRLADLYLRTGELAKAELLVTQLDSANPGNADVLALLAQAATAAGKLPAAADTYTRLAALRPGTALPHVRLASVQLAQHNEAGALDSLQRALALEPDQLDAQLTLLNLLLGQKKFDAALALAREAQRRHPDDAPGYKLEGDVLAAQNKFAPALSAYERAFALGKRGALLVQVHATLLKLGRGKDADNRLGQWLQSHPADVPTRLYFASGKLVARDYPAAITQLTAVLQADPDNIIALNDLAWACQQGKDKRALGFAERAYRLAPNSPVIMDTLGWVYLQGGEPARALALLQKATALAPGASAIRYHLGMVLAQSGDKRGARREIEQVLVSPQPFSEREQARALLATL